VGRCLERGLSNRAAHESGHDKPEKGKEGPAQGYNHMFEPSKPKCELCRNTAKGEVKLKTCTACKSVKYCSRECQRAHWKVHKPACKAAQAEASTLAGAGPNEPKA
jgi:hypothetical protein